MEVTAFVVDIIGSSVPKGLFFQCLALAVLSFGATVHHFRATHVMEKTAPGRIRLFHRLQ